MTDIITKFWQTPGSFEDSYSARYKSVKITVLSISIFSCLVSTIGIYFILTYFVKLGIAAIVMAILLGCSGLYSLLYYYTDIMNSLMTNYLKDLLILNFGDILTRRDFVRVLVSDLGRARQYWLIYNRIYYVKYNTIDREAPHYQAVQRRSSAICKIIDVLSINDLENALLKSRLGEKFGKGKEYDASTINAAFLELMTYNRIFTVDFDFDRPIREAEAVYDEENEKLTKRRTKSGEMTGICCI